MSETRKTYTETAAEAVNVLVSAYGGREKLLTTDTYTKTMSASLLGGVYEMLAVIADELHEVNENLKKLGED